ncbi:hypothetical protein BOSEA31B_10567 [Hyphomicrobiales bacterium]|nr:hypothetical protein BOSEA31B_10567 [Hyphomicrobiales bacterium]CAH1700422.1 hypothetical protein BOSEA1005_20121 [Hyphomicrobiales bacterium]CAI0344303.1 transposase [Hyphomicrobiales bacterium]
MLNIIDEFTHECLAIRIDRRLKAIDVIDVLSDLFILRGVPEHIRSDNGPEFVAKAYVKSCNGYSGCGYGDARTVTVSANYRW